MTNDGKTPDEAKAMDELAKRPIKDGYHVMGLETRETIGGGCYAVAVVAIGRAKGGE